MVTQTYATARWQRPPTHIGWVRLPPGYSGMSRERLVICQRWQRLPRLIKAAQERGWRLKKIPEDGSGLNEEQGISLHKHAIRSALAWDAITAPLSCGWQFPFVCEHLHRSKQTSASPSSKGTPAVSRFQYKPEKGTLKRLPEGHRTSSSLVWPLIRTCGPASLSSEPHAADAGDIKGSEMWEK